MKIFITGASYGVGRAIAYELAPHCTLLLLHGRDQTRLEETRERALGHGAENCECISADFLEAGAEKKITDWISTITTELDVLVLNAGFYREGTLMDFPSTAYEDDFRANVHVNLYLIQSMLPLIDRGQKRRVFIMGSTAAYEAYPMVPAYGVQKWALRGLATNLRQELRSYGARGIGVTFVAPGATWTGMWEGEQLPEDRLLLPSDIGKLISACLTLSHQAVVEEIKVVPMLGDLHE